MSECVEIPDLFPGHSKDLFCIPGHYYHAISEVLIPYGLIQDRLKKIAKDIMKTVQEESYTEDPTRNICLDAESLVLTREEEEVTILDLIADDKNDFDDLKYLPENEDTNSPPPAKKISKINIRSFAALEHQRRESLHLLCVLKTDVSNILQRIKCPSAKGGYKFFLDLLSYINQFNANQSRNSIQIRVDFIKVEEVSRGRLSIEGVENIDLIRHSTVVVVEDVVDTGRIMGQLVSELERYFPKRILIGESQLRTFCSSFYSLCSACLLQKRSRVESYRPHFVGFKVPNKMLVGYALDYNQYFKDLTHICILNRFGLEKFT